MGIYLYQAHLMREQQKLATWPHLLVMVGNIPHFQLNIKNAGLGPAVIHEVKFVHGGSTVDGYRAFVRNLAKPEHWDSAYGSNIEGSVVMAGEERNLAVVEDPTVRKEVMNRFWEKNSNLQITYSSVYGDCWVSDINGVKKREPWKGAKIF